MARFITISTTWQSKPIKKSDIYDGKGFEDFIHSYNELMKKLKLVRLGQIKNCRCPNCGATKDKNKCDYCGT